MEKSTIPFIKKLFDKFWENQNANQSSNKKEQSNAQKKTSYQLVSVCAQLRDSLSDLMDSEPPLIIFVV